VYHCSAPHLLNVAACDLDALRIDPAVVLRKQLGNHGTDVVGNTRSSQCCPFGHPFVDLRIVADDAAAEIRLRGTRSDHVNGNLSRPEFLRLYFVSTSTAPFIEPTCDNRDLMFCAFRHIHSPFDFVRGGLARIYFGIVDSKTRASATTRAVNCGSRTSSEPSIGWPSSS
jgi:hypothetical protein